MSDHPIDDRRIRQAMDACRPDGSDLADPAMAFLAERLAADPALAAEFDRLRQIDKALASTFHQVPVPAGLADRICARLAEVRNASQATTEHGAASAKRGRAQADRPASALDLPARGLDREADRGLDSGPGPAKADGPDSGPDRQVDRPQVECPQVERPLLVAQVGEPGDSQPRPVVGRRRHGLRAWLLAGAAGMAVAASLLVALLTRDSGPPVVAAPQILEDARQRFEADWGSQGQLVAESEPPAAFPAGADFDVSRFPEIRWRRIAGFLGSRGVAYDINVPGGPRATLYVVRATAPDLPAAPPLHPSQTTGNRSVGAWQSGELVYALVVEGGPREYQGFLLRRTWT